MVFNIKEFFAYKEMVLNLIRRELRGKYKGSLLGFLWTYVNPLCQIVIYAFFFSNIFKSGIEEFYIYLIVSMFPWNMFSGGLLQGIVSIRYQGDLVKKIFFPRQILPFVTVSVNFVNMIISFVIIYSILLLSGWGVDISIQWWLVPIMFIEFVFTFGLALLLSAIEVYFRDVEHIMSVMMMVWMYITPMFYNISFIPEQYLPFFKCNPMLYIIGMYQQVLYYKILPSLDYIVRATLVAFVTLIIGCIVFGKLEKRFAEEL